MSPKNWLAVFVGCVGETCILSSVVTHRGAFQSSFRVHWLIADTTMPRWCASMLCGARCCSLIRLSVLSLPRCILERQRHIGQQMINRLQQATDWVFLRCRSKIFGGHVQINLRTGNQFVAEQVPDRHDIDAGLHEMRCKRVAKSMR